MLLRRNGPVVKSVESVLRLEGSLWWERFVKELQFKGPFTGRALYRRAAQSVGTTFRISQ